MRSSASHVFRADDLVLRMAPLGTPQAEAVVRSATTAQILAAAGAPVPSSVASLEGLLVEEVDGMVVTALPVVPGTTYDDDELTADLARLWGRTLARFHETGYVHETPSPTTWSSTTGPRPSWTSTTPSPATPSATSRSRCVRGRHRVASPTCPGRSPQPSCRDIRRPGASTWPGCRQPCGEVERRTLASYLAHATTPAAPDWPDWAVRLHAVVSERAVDSAPSSSDGPRSRACARPARRRPGRRTP